jgi:hypothetical protein
VILDFDAGTFTTQCGAVAVRAAQDLGAKLVDPLLDAATCASFDQTLRCHQELQPRPNASNQPRDFEWLLVEFRGIDRPRLVAVAIGHPMRAIQLFDQIAAQVAAATCP